MRLPHKSTWINVPDDKINEFHDYYMTKQCGGLVLDICMSRLKNSLNNIIKTLYCEKAIETMSRSIKSKILEIRKCFSRLREAFFHIIRCESYID